MKAAVKGNLRSKTNWLAIFTALIGYLQLPDTQKHLATVINHQVGPDLVEFILASLTMCCGMVAIVLRNMTTESIIEKGQG